jgi:hypothetical protein
MNASPLWCILLPALAVLLIVIEKIIMLVDEAAADYMKSLVEGKKQ